MTNCKISIYIKSDLDGEKDKVLSLELNKDSNQLGFKEAGDVGFHELLRTRNQRNQNLNEAE